MFEPAERLKNVKVSASAAMTRKVRELRAQGVKIVGLSSGEPDFKRRCTPSRRRNKAALAGDTKYPPQDGVKPAQEGDPEEVQARQQSRLRARRDHGLQRQQADHVRRDYGEREPGRRGDHPRPRLDQLCRPGEAVRRPCRCRCRARRTTISSLRAADLDAAITRQDQMGGAELPQQSTGAVCSRAEMREIADVCWRIRTCW